jgi:hypothetical protein
MPNCDFYAAGPDHRSLLEFVLSLDDCDVYELHSAVDREIVRFRTLEDVGVRYDVSSWDVGTGECIRLQIHPHAAGGRVMFDRVALSPTHTGGTFRYSTMGWGLVQLYLEAPRDGRLRASHTNHNSGRRAVAHAPSHPGLGSVAEWNWAAVSRWSRRLNRFIQKAATEKRDGRAVLPHASRLAAGGVALR